MDVLRLAELYGLDAENVLGDGCSALSIRPDEMRAVQSYFGAALFNHVLRGSSPRRLDPNEVPPRIRTHVEYQQAGFVSTSP
jgi:hypothetical protein